MINMNENVGENNPEKELEEFLRSEGYVRRVKRILKSRKISILGLNLIIELEIIPEVSKKLGKSSKEIKENIKSILMNNV